MAKNCSLIYFQSESCVADLLFIKRLKEDPKMPTALRENLYRLVVNEFSTQQLEQLEALVKTRVTGSLEDLPRFDLPYGSSTFLLTSNNGSTLITLDGSSYETSIFDTKIKAQRAEQQERKRGRREAE